MKEKNSNTFIYSVLKMLTIIFIILKIDSASLDFGVKMKWNLEFVVNFNISEQFLTQNQPDFLK